MNTNKLFLLLSLAVLIPAPQSFAQENGSSATTIDLLAKGSIGYAHYDEIYGALDARLGMFADINIAVVNPISIQTGLEFKSTGLGKTYVYSGLSDSSSDFYERYHYHINYLGIPIIAKYKDKNNPSSWLNGFFFGLGINIPLAATYDWERHRTGLKSSSVDDSGNGDIKHDKLGSPAVSIRFGLDERYGDKWGSVAEWELIRNIFTNSEYSISAFRIGVIYYL